MRTSRHDLYVLAAATQRPRELARVIAGAVVEGHEVDVEVRCNGPGYVVVLRVIAGERIVTETEWPVDWSVLEEATRFGLLAIYAGQLVASWERTRRRAEAYVAS